MGPVLISVLIGTFTVTSYRSVPSQTDNSPLYTSIGEHVCADGIAVSQDILKQNKLKYGDWVFVTGVGLKRVNDTMNPRWRNRMDVWVGSKEEEKAFFKKYKISKFRVYKVTIK